MKDPEVARNTNPNMGDMRTRDTEKSRKLFSPRNGKLYMCM